MDMLPGDVPTYYAEGTAVRARQVQSMLEAGVAYYENELGVNLPVYLALMGPDEWRKINPPTAPYSLFLPGVAAGPPHVMYLPAQAGHALDSLVQHISLKSVVLQEMDLSPIEISQRYVALVGFHELGHLVAREYSLQAPSSWFSEFLASFIAYAFLKEEAPEDARIWQEVSLAFVEEIEPHKVVLEEIHSGVGVDNYIWYQGSLQVRADEVYRQQGFTFIRKLKSLQASQVWPRDEPELLLSMLEEISPGFEAWATMYHSAGE